MEEEFRDLGARLISVQDAERRYIAREFHDNLNRRMAMLSVELYHLDQAMPARQNALHARVQDLWARTQDIASEIQRLSYHLHSFKLEYLGLGAAVKDFYDEVSEQQSLKIKFRHRGFPAVLSKDLTLCIFRILLESLHNVIKHSGSRQALVVLEKIDQAVQLSVSDKGHGFDQESARIKGGLSLSSMKGRLRLGGGEILIHSQPSRGTQIDVSVPLARQTRMRFDQLRDTEREVCRYHHRAVPEGREVL